MRKFWMSLFIASFAMCILVGCGREDAYVENENGAVAFLSAIPPNGSSITSSASIVLLFNGQPENVASSTGTVTAIGNVVTITGPFVGDLLLLVVTWRGGTITLVYFVSGV